MAPHRRRVNVQRLILLVGTLAVGACAQQLPPPIAPAVAEARYALPDNRAFELAVQRGTRTRGGEPGPRYWQQWAEYDIEAALEPGSDRVRGRATIRYVNRSPDTLRTLAVHLRQNLHAPSARRTRDVQSTGGIRLDTVRVRDRVLQPLNLAAAAGEGYEVNGTIAWLRLAEPLLPGGSAELGFVWEFTVPPPTTPRMGTDREVYLIGYWYPQMAVYDDISGWHTDPYLGNGEFYMGYANYRVALTLPAGWLAAATGELRNANEVLSDTVRSRLARARTASAVVPIVRANERGPGRATATGTNGRLTWRFAADTVRDFVWTASDDYLWDATVAEVGDHTGDGRPDTAAINAFYRPAAANWRESARYTRHAIEYMSRLLWPYPYPHMTSVEGFVFGMEYPMVTLVTDPGDATFLYRVIAHEVGHMWFPMLVGSDEKRYAWQDEGFAQYLEAPATMDLTDGRVNPATESLGAYLQFVRTGGELPLMRHADDYPSEASYAIAAYEKAATVMHTLRAMVGAAEFDAAVREYGRAWIERHPHPYDFFNAMSSALDRDLSWFWRGWFFETWTLDQAIGGVEPGADSVTITIENRGEMPMPVPLAITRAGGGVERVVVPVDVWLAGQRRTTLRVAGTPAVTRVEIDPQGIFPDVNRDNQRWTP